MKVVQINTLCGYAAPGRIATEIHQELIKKGHDSYVAYGRGQIRNIELNKAIKIGSKLGVFMHVLKTRIFDSHGFGSKRATKNFIKKIKVLDPDVIHLHNIHGYYINIEILFEYLKESNKKIVWTLHDVWAFTGHSATIPQKLEGKFNNGVHYCTGKKNYPRSLMFDHRKKNGIRKQEIFTGVKNLTIITPSIWLANLAKKSFLGEYPIKVINNGVDLEIFKEDSKSVNQIIKTNKKILLGVASVWSDKKGLNIFFELAELISSKYVIVLVGLNKKQLNSLPENIIGIKRTNSINDLVNLYSSAHIFINPTFADNYPTVNLEAQACGTPVITFDTGGSAETILENMGIITNKKDVDSVLKAIETVEDNYHNFKSFNKTDISKETFTRNMLELYTKN